MASRRDLLKGVAVAGVVATGGYLLLEYAPWLNYDQQADQGRRPFQKDAVSSETMRELVRYATLAASGHNTQPWKFALKENAVEIHPDYNRHLQIVDPNDRELWISLGCALENLVIAARAAGYAPEITYPDTADFIHVHLTADKSQGSPLFDAIPFRQNVRSEYDGQSLKSEELALMQTLPQEPGITLRFALNPADMTTVTECVRQGNLDQYADKAFVEELLHWLRFTKKEALASGDGLYSRCSGNPDVPRWIGGMFVARTTPQQQADADAKKLHSSSGAVVIASETEDKTAWVRTGQVYERLTLKMTSLNLKSAFLNQPIEVAAVRGRFQSALGLGNALPQLLMRFGYADSLPRSLRRPVEQVIL